jgi:hypothetical protein
MYNFTPTPSKLYERVMQQKQNSSGDVCASGKVKFTTKLCGYGQIERTLGQHGNELGHVFFERPDIRTEVHDVFAVLNKAWTEVDDYTYSEEKMFQWMQTNAEEVEPEDDYECEYTAYHFYLETDIALYSMCAEWPTDAPSKNVTLYIDVYDKRYLVACPERALLEVAENCGDIAFAREVCRFVEAQLPYCYQAKMTQQLKNKLSNSIAALNVILRG